MPSYLVPLVWNSLLDDVKMAMNINSFKRTSCEKQKETFIPTTTSQDIGKSHNILFKLGKDSVIFCCTGSRENYFGLIGRQNDNNPTF